MKRAPLSRLAHAMLAPHVTPAAGVSPDAANALLKFQSALEFGGWTKAEARAEIERLGNKSITTKGNDK